MKAFNLVTLSVIIFGGLNWGAVSWFGEDMVSALLGRFTLATRTVYLAVALAALYQLVPLWLSFRLGELDVQADRVPE